MHPHAAAHLHVSWTVTLLCAALAVAYLVALRRLGPVFVAAPGDRPATARQHVAFLAGVAVLWLALGSPLHLIGEQALLSVHLLQHLLLGLVVPPLLLAGLPRWLAEVLVHPRPVRSTLGALAQPWFAVGLFALLLVVLHLPVVVGVFATSPVVHGAAHALLLAAGVLLWLPLLGTVPTVVTRLHPAGRMLTLFAVSIVPSVPASVLTFAEASPYPLDAAAAAAFGLTPLQDLWAAGLLAKLGGGVALWLVAAGIFLRWAAEADAREQRRRPVPTRAPA